MSETTQLKEYKISANIEAMKTALSAVNQMDISEATFSLESDGLRFRGMDPSHISLLEIFLERGKSIAYDHEFSFAVDPSEFLKVLKTFKVYKFDRESLKMELFGVNFGAPSDRYMTIKYKDQEAKILLVDPIVCSIPKINLKFTSKLVLIDEVVKALGAIEGLSETVTFKTNKDEVSFKVSSKGDFVRHLEIELMMAGESDIIEDTEASYSLICLNPILKTYLKSTENSSEDLKLEYGNKLPLKLSFKIDTKSSTISAITYYLAPRIIE